MAINYSLIVLNRLTEQRMSTEAWLCILMTSLYHKTSELCTTTLKQTGSQMCRGEKGKVNLEYLRMDVLHSGLFGDIPLFGCLKII